MMTPLLLFSCEETGNDAPTITLLLRSQTISEGAVVDANSTTVLTLYYNNSV